MDIAQAVVRKTKNEQIDCDIVCSKSLCFQCNDGLQTVRSKSCERSQACVVSQHPGLFRELQYNAHTTHTRLKRHGT
ncbi:hypothetical protein FVE85_4175 [Porphyridium purpureum]|uniref:Uncharacterized protein n=1 Tax=Porphyridium purpureum TaxID=35688 RepID=A0A5J4YTE4_PORPP|nr:hypothetical protein FVE85_4175 [Porphyridium purpureum]|eukprot:POR4867..scf229_5